MIKRTLALALGAVLAVSALLPAGGLAQTEAPLLIEARAAQTAYAPGSKVQIEARVTNAGTEPISFWLPPPCDPLFAVTASAEGAAIPAGLETEPMICIQVIRFVTLAPGETLKEMVDWAVPAGLKEGEYQLDLRFLGRLEGEAPATTLTLQIQAGAEAPPRVLTDIETHWAAPQIAAGIQRGFIQGYPDASFRPENGVSRSELIKMVVAAQGLPLTPGTADDHWVAAQGYLGAAVSAGLVSPGSLLQPDQPLMRQEVVTILAVALGAPPDADPVKVALEAGIIKGYYDGTLGLERPVTRAEATVMILRLLDALAQ